MSEQPQSTALALSPIQQAAVDEVANLGRTFHMTAPGAVLADVLISTAFSGDTIPNDAQLIALVVVARQYGLNPFLKEIYAYPDKKKGIVPIVGVDGWITIINKQPMLDGIEFDYSPNMVDLAALDPKMQGSAKQGHEWIDCIITRKDRDKPIVVREYLDEVYKAKGNYDGPWQTHPKRFHRHKTLIQCARVAFGFAGIYDQDEADRIIENIALEDEAPRRTGPARPQSRSKAKADAPPQDERREPERQPDDEQPTGREPEDAEFEPVADEQPQEAAVDERSNAADEQRGATEAAGQGDLLDDWEPKPGEASAGTLEFIRRKGEAKGYDAIAICQKFTLNALRGITEERAAEILSWLKTAPQNPDA